ncbi:hypothetical protein [Emticicia sp. SJ17W-69]|uniref:hypothetical protein n=1 Tax=Emticicia sp. SJ17W-69 TaxID=3421657 RepID=UPI003EB6D5F7
MKKLIPIIYLLFGANQLIQAQSITLQPNTGNNGNLLIKSTQYVYGNISTTDASGADLFFRISEPTNGIGIAGTQIGAISTYPSMFQLSTYNSSMLNFNVNNKNVLRILPNGYIGINQTAPSRFFHVNGSTILSETSDSSNVQIGSTNLTNAKLVVNNTNFQHGVLITSPFNPGGFALNVDGTTRLQGLTIIEGVTNIQNALNAQQGTFNGSVAITGNLNVSGSVSKGSGSFKIDHPLDPENKLLYHSFVESPDMMNVYNGNVVTDEKGFATITLPDYFEALNKDFRYQLTPIGSFAQAMVAKKVKDNQFIIQTDKPNIEISWQVTGIRNDAYAKKFRIPNTVEKSASEKGKYLYPEAFEKQ